MKNKEDASKGKSDEYLAFEALAKHLINVKKEDCQKLEESSKHPKTTKTKSDEIKR